MNERIDLEIGDSDRSQVKKLVLDHCPCNGGAIEGITDEFVSLQVLSLNGTNLSTLRGFPALPSLRKLELADNRLSSGLEKIAACLELEILNLANNKIRDVETLEPLQDLPKLKILTIESNPVADKPDTRNRIFQILPDLIFLDDMDREGREKESGDEDDEEDDDEEGGEYEEDDEEGEEQEEGASGRGYGQGGDEEEEEEGEYDDDQGGVSGASAAAAAAAAVGASAGGAQGGGGEEEYEEEEEDEPGLDYLQREDIEDDVEGDEFQPGEDVPSEEVEDDADEDDSAAKRAREA